MPIFSCDKELCRQDGICALVCPVYVIDGAEGAHPQMRPGMENDCIACGHCIAFCPHGAAKVDVLPEVPLPIDRSLLPAPEALEALCRARRSIRRFKREPVERPLLERILRTADYAPTASNRRPVRWILLSEPKLLQAVGEKIAEWLGIWAASDPNADSRPATLLQAWKSGLDPFLRGAPHLLVAVTPANWVWGVSDAAIALTYVELAALPLGVGACWAGFVTAAARNHAPLRELLGVGETEAVAGGQMLGRMALRPASVPPRPPLDVRWL